MGRPPIGERAMTPAEKMRRYRERKFGNRSAVTKPTAKVVAAQAARTRELEAELERETVAHVKTLAMLEQAAETAQKALSRVQEAELARERKRRGEGQLTRGRRAEFSEEGKLRAEIVRLKSDIIKLKAM